MPTYRSYTSTQGRNMAGARALWRATGTKDTDINKPIIAIANSFTQFVPGHVHLHDIGQIVVREIEKCGAVAKEFDTIAVDDGIAMGHDGMLFSLPSREIIADSVEYMCRAHCADALVCISNCDKVTPGMLLAAMRLNIPTIFVSGGPMEVGKFQVADHKKLDLIDIMVMAADPKYTDEEIKQAEIHGCPTCGSCSGMFTANSMNCLTEALGLSQPGNGSLLATHLERKELFLKAARRIVEMTKDYYENNNEKVLPKSIATKEAFENAMSLDIAMGGSTNTVLHLLAVATEAGVDFTMKDIDRLSRIVPHLCKVAPSTNQFHVSDVHRAGGVMGILAELDRAGLIHKNALHVSAPTIGELITKYDIKNNPSDDVKHLYLAAPGGQVNNQPFHQNEFFDSLDEDRENGCIRDKTHAYSQDGGLATLYGNIALDGCIVKTAGVDESILKFKGPAIVYESQEDAVSGILGGSVKAGDVVVIRYEGPKGGPGMQEMLYPTSYLKSMGLGKKCALITDGRFSGGTSGLSIGHASPEAASGGAIGLVENGDIIEIDIPNRTINLAISEGELLQRRENMNKRGTKAWKPLNRERVVPYSLKAYASLASSADKGAARDRSKLED